MKHDKTSDPLSRRFAPIVFTVDPPFSLLAGLSTWLSSSVARAMQPARRARSHQSAPQPATPVPAPTPMSKPKSKPPALTNKEPPPAKAAPAARARDLDDDVFDVAHNALLRTKVVDQHSGHSSGRAAVRAEWDDGLPSKSIVTPEAMEKAGRAETERAEVQAAVDAAWAKSAELQEQAVAAARSTTSRELRERHERELREKLQEQETRLRHEAEEALKKIWETANRERDRAVEEALVRGAR